jgi:PRP38 family
MANATDPIILQVCGTDPQNCLDYIVRQKIYNTRYWKEVCFGLSVVDVMEKSVQQLRNVGSSLPHNTIFLCLLLKLLQLHPEHDIIDSSFVQQTTFKYTRVLGGCYIRLTSRPIDIYHSLESIVSDYRKVCVYNHFVQKWELTTVDQLVYDCLQITSQQHHLSSSSSSSSVSKIQSYLNITFPRLPARHVLQEAGYIVDGPRIVVSSSSSSVPLHDTLLQYLVDDLTRGTKNTTQEPDDDTNRTLTTELYAQAALQYLEHLATVQQSPAAISAWHRRLVQQQHQEQQSLPSQPCSSSSSNVVNTTINNNNNSTNEKNSPQDDVMDARGDEPKPTGPITKRKESQPQLLLQQQQEPHPGSSAVCATTNIQHPTTTKQQKKRNVYGTLFKK